MAELLEAAMLVCFGFSWPISLLSNIRAKTAQHMSLQFILLITLGYVAGISSKIIRHQFNYVFAVYILNLIMVSANIAVYFINRGYDRRRKAEAVEKKRLAQEQARQAAAAAKESANEDTEEA